MKTKNLTLVALFAALMAVLSQISFSLGPIPFSLGIMGAFFCGLMLTPRDAVLAVLVYLLLGAAGLPVFAGFSGGLATLSGMTGGYLIGYLLIALCLSLVRAAVNPASVSGKGILFAGGLAGIALCYGFGTAWFMRLSGNTLAASLSMCVFPFLVPDLLKLAAAILLSAVLRRRLSLAGYTA